MMIEHRLKITVLKKSMRANDDRTKVDDYNTEIEENANLMLTREGDQNEQVVKSQKLQD